MEVKDARELLENWVESDRAGRDNRVDNDFDQFCERRNVAIETILKKLEDKEDKTIENNNADDYFSISNHPFNRRNVG